MESQWAGVVAAYGAFIKRVAQQTACDVSQAETQKKRNKDAKRRKREREKRDRERRNR